jgi:hypothetical protein
VNGWIRALENTFAVKPTVVKEELENAGPQKREQITMLDVCAPLDSLICYLQHPEANHTHTQQPRKTYNLAILLNRILSTHSMDWFKGEARA